jgi:hypothetical protein
MYRAHRSPKATWLQVLVAAGGLLLLVGLYLVAMRATLGVSKLSPGEHGDTRDLVYFYVHAAALVLAAGAGFGAGKWLSGLGVGYAALFVVVLAVAMVFAQLGSHALACEGHNDIIRHWSCGPATT